MSDDESLTDFEEENWSPSVEAVCAGETQPQLDGDTEALLEAAAVADNTASAADRCDGGDSSLSTNCDFDSEDDLFAGSFSCTTGDVGTAVCPSTAITAPTRDGVGACAGLMGRVESGRNVRVAAACNLVADSTLEESQVLEAMTVHSPVPDSDEEALAVSCRLDGLSAGSVTRDTDSSLCATSPPHRSTTDDNLCVDETVLDDEQCGDAEEDWQETQFDQDVDYCGRAEDGSEHPDLVMSESVARMSEAADSERQPSGVDEVDQDMIATQVIRSSACRPGDSRCSSQTQHAATSLDMSEELDQDLIATQAVPSGFGRAATDAAGLDNCGRANELHDIDEDEEFLPHTQDLIETQLVERPAKGTLLTSGSAVKESTWGRIDCSSPDTSHIAVCSSGSTKTEDPLPGGGVSENMDECDAEEWADTQILGHCAGNKEAQNIEPEVDAGLISEPSHEGGHSREQTDKADSLFCDSQDIGPSTGSIYQVNTNHCGGTTDRIDVKSSLECTAEDRDISGVTRECDKVLVHVDVANCSDATICCAPTTLASQASTIAAYPGSSGSMCDGDVVEHREPGVAEEQQSTFPQQEPGCEHGSVSETDECAGVLLASSSQDARRCNVPERSTPDTEACTVKSGDDSRAVDVLMPDGINSAFTVCSDKSPRKQDSTSCVSDVEDSSLINTPHKVENTSRSHLTMLSTPQLVNALGQLKRQGKLSSPSRSTAVRKLHMGYSSSSLSCSSSSPSPPSRSLNVVDALPSQPEVPQSCDHKESAPPRWSFCQAQSDDELPDLEELPAAPSTIPSASVLSSVSTAIPIATSPEASCPTATAPQSTPSSVSSCDSITASTSTVVSSSTPLVPTLTSLEHSVSSDSSSVSHCGAVFQRPSVSRRASKRPRSLPLVESSDMDSHARDVRRPIVTKRSRAGRPPAGAVSKSRARRTTTDAPSTADRTVVRDVPVRRSARRRNATIPAESGGDDVPSRRASCTTSTASVLAPASSSGVLPGDCVAQSTVTTSHSKVAEPVEACVKIRRRCFRLAVAAVSPPQNQRVADASVTTETAADHDVSSCRRRQTRSGSAVGRPSGGSSVVTSSSCQPSTDRHLSTTNGASVGGVRRSRRLCESRLAQQQQQQQQPRQQKQQQQPRQRRRQQHSQSPQHQTPQQQQQHEPQQQQQQSRQRRRQKQNQSSPPQQEQQASKQCSGVSRQRESSCRQRARASGAGECDESDAPVVVSRLTRRSAAVSVADDATSTCSDQCVSTGASERAGRMLRSRRDQQQQQSDYVRVLFTGFSTNCAREHDIVSALGGEVVDDVTRCSVLVSDGRLRRTIKLLCAVSLRVPVVSPRWLLASRRAGHFTDPWQHLLLDREAEQRWKFSLSSTLRSSSLSSSTLTRRSFLTGTAASSGLLSDWHVHVTASVKPPPSQLQQVVECAGGVYVSHVTSVTTSVCERGSRRSRDQDQQHHGRRRVMIISCDEDRQCWSDVMMMAGSRSSFVSDDRVMMVLVSAELLLAGILRNQLDIPAHLLH